MNSLPFPAPRKITLLIAPASAISPLYDRVAQLSLQGPLSVLDGGNVYQGYALARSLYRQAPRQLALDALQRVMLSRVFTCYQMAALLNKEDITGRPLLVLDFLLTFYDQSVNAVERRRLLNACTRRLQSLSRRVPVAIWMQQRAVIPEDSLSFVQMLMDAAEKVWQPARALEPSARQLALFPAG